MLNVMATLGMLRPKTKRLGKTLTRQWKIVDPDGKGLLPYMFAYSGVLDFVRIIGDHNPQGTSLFERPEGVFHALVLYVTFHWPRFGSQQMGVAKKQKMRLWKNSLATLGIDQKLAHFDSFVTRAVFLPHLPPGHCS